MKTGMDWYKRYPRKFLGGVMRLTAKQHAVYSVTLELIYEHGGSFDCNAGMIAGYVADMGVAAVRRALAELCAMGKLAVREGQIYNDLASEVTAEAAEISEKRAAAGAVGGKSKRNPTRKSPKNDSFFGDFSTFSGADFEPKSRWRKGEAKAFAKALGSHKRREEKIESESSSHSHDARTRVDAGAKGSVTRVARFQAPGSIEEPLFALDAAPAPVTKRDAAALYDEFRRCAAAMNEQFGGGSWPVPRSVKPSEGRLKALIDIARLIAASEAEEAAESGREARPVVEAWTETLRRCARSQYLRSVSWFGLDWLLKPGNYDKAREGNYDDRNPRTNAHDRPQTHHEAQLRRLAGEMGLSLAEGDGGGDVGFGAPRRALPGAGG